MLLNVSFRSSIYKTFLFNTEQYSLKVKVKCHFCFSGVEIPFTDVNILFFILSEAQRTGRRFTC